MLDLTQYAILGIPEIEQGHLTTCGIVLFLMTIDYFSGVIAAVKNKSFKSSKMREGLWHKAGIGLILIMCWVLNLHYESLGLPSHFGSVLPIAHTAVAVMEIASIAENAAKFNPKLRKLAFWKMLKGMNEDNNKIKEKK